MSQPDHTAAAPLDAELIIARTQRWLERAVIGLNLCPFARSVHIQQRIRYRVSSATGSAALQAELVEELAHLRSVEASVTETTLLIHPLALDEFLDFNDFLVVADETLEDLGLDGVFQIASFHPQFQFAGSGVDDIENFTNRAPYPMLHLLREDSVSRVLDKIDDPDAIFRHNIKTMRDLGKSGWDRLWSETQED